MRPAELRRPPACFEAVEKLKSGRRLKIAAFAGAGKTITLQVLANVRRSRGLYLAFNKSFATEAKERFPKAVDCRTTHSIAYRSGSAAFGSSAKLSDAIHPKQLAELAGYKPKPSGRISS